MKISVIAHIFNPCLLKELVTYMQSFDRVVKKHTILHSNFTKSVTKKDKFKYTPSQVITISFFTVSFIGALLLMLPISNTNGQYLGFVDAFFMSVSATCVTGLGVVHLGNDFTFFGQTVIMFLIQIGGLGYMTMTTILIYLVGKRLSISDSKIFSTSTGSDSQLDVKDFAIKIGIVTLLIEGLGAILIFKDSFDIVSNKHSYQSPIFTVLHSLFEAVFHSVSAYCNAGLSLYESCLETHSTNYYLLTILSALIILGGLGYTVLTEIFNWLIGKKKAREPFSLHTKVSLGATFIVILVGGLVQFSLIYIQDLSSTIQNAVAGVHPDNPVLHNFSTAFVQTIGARTAGFNSIPLTLLGDPSLVLLMVLMFMGGCPGGTAGGIKLTTLVLILSTIVAGIKDHQNVKILNRSVSEASQRNAFLVFVSTLIFITFFTFLIGIFDQSLHLRFIDYLFEVISAFSTVGFSTGITTSLCDKSLITLCFCMIIGRVGPLVFLMAIFSEEKGKEIRYPEENLLIG